MPVRSKLQETTFAASCYCYMIAWISLDGERSRRTYYYYYCSDAELVLSEHS